jgi:hypothetical protein
MTRQIEVSNWFGRFMRRRGWSGFTLPLPRRSAVVFYWLLPGETVDAGFRAHEFVHVEQIRHFGALGFAARYLWLLMRHGYKRHPMELAAYAFEAHVRGRITNA